MSDGWISVKDALPRVGHPVLGWVYGSRAGTLQEEPDEHEVVYIKRENRSDQEPFWVHRGDDHIGLNVTHWRELPNGPSNPPSDEGTKE